MRITKVRFSSIRARKNLKETSFTQFQSNQSLEKQIKFQQSPENIIQLCESNASFMTQSHFIKAVQQLAIKKEKAEKQDLMYIFEKIDLENLTKDEFMSIILIIPQLHKQDESFQSVLQKIQISLQNHLDSSIFQLNELIWLYKQTYTYKIFFDKILKQLNFTLREDEFLNKQDFIDLLIVIKNKNDTNFLSQYEFQILQILLNKKIDFDNLQELSQIFYLISSLQLQNKPNFYKTPNIMISLAKVIFLTQQILQHIEEISLKDSIFLLEVFSYHFKEEEIFENLKKFIIQKTQVLIENYPANITINQFLSLQKLRKYFEKQTRELIDKNLIQNKNMMNEYQVQQAVSNLFQKDQWFHFFKNEQIDNFQFILLKICFQNQNQLDHQMKIDQILKQSIKEKKQQIMVIKLLNDFDIHLTPIKSIKQIYYSQLEENNIQNIQLLRYERDEFFQKKLCLQFTKQSSFNPGQFILKIVKQQSFGIYNILNNVVEQLDQKQEIQIMVLKSLKYVPDSLQSLNQIQIQELLEKIKQQKLYLRDLYSISIVLSQEDQKKYDMLLFSYLAENQLQKLDNYIVQQMMGRLISQHELAVQDLNFLFENYFKHSQNIQLNLKFIQKIEQIVQQEPQLQNQYEIFINENLILTQRNYPTWNPKLKHEVVIILMEMDPKHISNFIPLISKYINDYIMSLNNYKLSNLIEKLDVQVIDDNKQIYEPILKILMKHIHKKSLNPIQLYNFLKKSSTLEFISDDFIHQISQVLDKFSAKELVHIFKLLSQFDIIFEAYNQIFHKIIKLVLQKKENSQIHEIIEFCQQINYDNKLLQKMNKNLNDKADNQHRKKDN